jgi:hypothetical protein
MNFRTLLIIVVILAASLSCIKGVDASRVLCEDFGSVNYRLETHSSVYQKAKYSMACLLERLPSGPSGGGPGN